MGLQLRARVLGAPDDHMVAQAWARGGVMEDGQWGWQRRPGSGSDGPVMVNGSDGGVGWSAVAVMD